MPASVYVITFPISLPTMFSNYRCFRRYGVETKNVFPPRVFSSTPSTREEKSAKKHFRHALSFQETREEKMKETCGGGGGISRPYSQLFPDKLASVNLFLNPYSIKTAHFKGRRRKTRTRAPSHVPNTTEALDGGTQKLA